MFYTDQHNLWYSFSKTADLIHTHTQSLVLTAEQAGVYVVQHY